MRTFTGVLRGIVHDDEPVERIDLRFRSLYRNEGRFENGVGNEIRRILGQGQHLVFQRNHALGEGVGLEDETARHDFQDFEGLEVRHGIHGKGQRRGTPLHAGQIHGVDEVARVEIPQKLRRTAQTHGNVIDHAFSYDQPFRQATVFHTQFHLSLHMVAAHDEIPQSRRDDEGEQHGKNGLQTTVTD